MSTALKAQVPGSQSPQPLQMNKPIHSQGGPGPFGQPQNAMNVAAHTNPSQATNMSQYSLNMSNYQSGPVAGGAVPVNHPSIQPASYSPPKPQIYNQPYQSVQQQHASTNLAVPMGNAPQNHQQEPTSDNIQKESKPHSNGTAELNTALGPSDNHLPLKRDNEAVLPVHNAASTVESVPAKALQPAEVPPVTTSVLGTTNLSNPLPTNTETATPNSEPAKVLPTSPAKEAPALVDGKKPEVKPTKPIVNEIETKVAQENASSEQKDDNKSANSEVVPNDIIIPSPNKPKIDVESASTSEKSPLKVATPRTPTRKPKTPKSDAESPPSSSKLVKTTIEPKPSTSRSPGGKAKRQRMRTQPYQSPLPELEILTKMTPQKNQTESKLIVFYKNEHLAVRNSEGGFFVCQAVQNVYKTSAKIKIRWLSQEKTDKSDEVYSPDFYDTIDFDCILTNLDLTRIEKGKFKLPAKEKTRTDNILKRAIAVEKGEDISLDDSLTEDNPDGLDVSLFKKEEQLVKNRKATKRQLSSRSASPHKEAKAAKLTPKKKSSPGGGSSKKSKSSSAVTKKSPAASSYAEAKRSSSGRAERAKRRTESSGGGGGGGGVVDVKKAKVLAKVVKRTVVVADSKKSSTAKKKIVKAKERKVMNQTEPSTSKGKKESRKERNAKKGKK